MNKIYYFHLPNETTVIVSVDDLGQIESEVVDNDRTVEIINDYILDEYDVIKLREYNESF